MNIRDHRSDISCAIGRLSGSREFDRVEVVDDRWVEVHGIAFVEGVDFSAGWNFNLSEVIVLIFFTRGLREGTYVWVGEDKFPQSRVESVTIDPRARRQNQVRR